MGPNPTLGWQTAKAGQGPFAPTCEAVVKFWSPTPRFDECFTLLAIRPLILMNVSRFWPSVFFGHPTPGFDECLTFLAIRPLFLTNLPLPLLYLYLTAPYLTLTSHAFPQQPRGFSPTNTHLVTRAPLTNLPICACLRKGRRQGGSPSITRTIIGT